MAVTGVSNNRVQPKINYDSATNNALLKKVNDDIKIFNTNQQAADTAMSKMPIVAIRDNVTPPQKTANEKIELPAVLQPPTSEQLQAEHANNANPFAAKQENKTEMPGIVAIRDNLKKTETAEKIELPKVLQPPTSEQLEAENAKKDNPFAKG